MIELQDLTIAYRGLPLVLKANATVGPGETVILTGETGSGKTSLIRALYGDLRPQTGSIIIDGHDLGHLPRRRLPKLRRRMGLIFQDDKLLDDRSVYDNIRFALSIRMRSSRDIKRRALEILTELGLSHLRSMMPRELSGGEAQRIGVARALANDPAIVLADEPTGNLDAETALTIFRYLAVRTTETRAMVIATHTPELAVEVFPHAHRWRLHGGRIIETRQGNHLSTRDARLRNPETGVD